MSYFFSPILRVFGSVVVVDYPLVVVIPSKPSIYVPSVGIRSFLSGSNRARDL
jgi:hypothetical protein